MHVRTCVYMYGRYAPATPSVKRGVGVGTGPGDGVGVLVYLFFKGCYFRVRVRLGLTLALTLILTLKQHSLIKNIQTRIPSPPPVVVS